MVTVGKLAAAWTVSPTYDRGYSVPGSFDVVKVIALSDNQATVQTLKGHFVVLPKSDIKPLPKYFAEAI